MPRHKHVYQVRAFRLESTVKSANEFVCVAYRVTQTIRGARACAARWRRLAVPGTVFPYPRVAIWRDGVLILDWRHAAEGKL